MVYDDCTSYNSYETHDGLDVGHKVKRYKNRSKMGVVTTKGLNLTAKNLIPTAQIKCDNLNAFVFKQSYKLVLLFPLLFYEAMHTVFLR